MSPPGLLDQTRRLLPLLITDLEPSCQLLPGLGSGRVQGGRESCCGENRPRGTLGLQGPVTGVIQVTGDEILGGELALENGISSFL